MTAKQARKVDKKIYLEVEKLNATTEHSILWNGEQGTKKMYTCQNCRAVWRGADIGMIAKRKLTNSCNPAKMQKQHDTARNWVARYNQWQDGVHSLFIEDAYVLCRNCAFATSTSIRKIAARDIPTACRNDGDKCRGGRRTAPTEKDARLEQIETRRERAKKPQELRMRDQAQEGDSLDMPDRSGEIRQDTHSEDSPTQRERITTKKHTLKPSRRLLQIMQRWEEPGSTEPNVLSVRAAVASPSLGVAKNRRRFRRNPTGIG